MSTAATTQLQPKAAPAQPVAPTPAPAPPPPEPAASRADRWAMQVWAAGALLLILWHIQDLIYTALLRR
jgi:hypothetical protein